MVQYSERTVFEHHPEYAGTPYEVLLSQLGTFRLRNKYPSGVPNQKPNQTNARFFPETGHWVGGRFWQYWQEHGGLPQQGYPLTDEFTEVSDLNGKPYLVQYFERAVFEYHPEYTGTPYEVLLSQLGTFRLRDKYLQPSPNPEATARHSRSYIYVCTPHGFLYSYPGATYFRAYGADPTYGANTTHPTNTAYPTSTPMTC